MCPDAAEPRVSQQPMPAQPSRNPMDFRMNLRTLFHTALAISMTLTTTACFSSALAGALADTRIVETKWKNPEGTVKFVKSAEAMGCKSHWTNNSLGQNLWLKCPGSVFDLPDAEIEYGFGENDEYLTVGCPKSDEKYCDGPINKVMANAM